MIAAVILLAACLATMTITAAIAASDWRRQVDARRVAEVALATASEGLIAARDAVKVAEGLHKAERERADTLELELHDVDVLLATGAGRHPDPGRSRLSSAIKRVANHAAGPDRSRSASNQGADEVPEQPVSRSSRGIGDPPTAPGDR